MSFKTVHPARHADATKRLAPGDGICLVAMLGGKRVRHLGAPPDQAVNLFLNVDEWRFHNAASISPFSAPCKRRTQTRTLIWGKLRMVTGKARFWQGYAGCSRRAGKKIQSRQRQLFAINETRWP